MKRECSLPRSTCEVARIAPGGRGFTLIEMTVSLGIVALLTVSLGSVVLLASHALPASDGGSSRMSTAMAAEQINADLRFATRIIEASQTHIVMLVPDRDKDGVDETVRYQWGGPGMPLLRTYNTLDPVAIAPSLQEFSLKYTTRKQESRHVETVLEESGEVELCRFTGWAGVSHAFRTVNITNLTWASQKFRVTANIPPDSTSWQVTRVSLRLCSNSALGSSVTVGIHRPTQLLGIIPMLLPIGSESLISSSILTACQPPRWKDALFTNVVLSDPAERDLIIVVKPALLTNSALLEYYEATNAPVDANVLQLSSDAGLTWVPTSNQHRIDAPFFVYGTYQSLQTREVVSEYTTLGHVTMTLQADADPSSRLTTGVQLANQPEVASP